ncbi:hypothetical protein B0A54_13344 [Friedmanniomyces endolithicus]|uniref:Transcription factor domain-containing protein n=1 Tax=Friedmanniomyces endolithicus TaxID=329885 RepID=A0A4U0UGW6_9PEZI|nr:hypothetical protein B0A54_13344 [Friedmanniomyces endolithicus]
MLPEDTGDHYATSTPTVETPSNDVRSPSFISSLISQDIYLCTTIDLLAASEGFATPSLTYFHKTVESPFITPYDLANWTIFKDRVVEAATHCSAVASAALAVQELYKARRNCLSHFKALPLYYVACEMFGEKMSSGQVGHDVDLVFILAFLVSLFETLAPQEAHRRPLALGHGRIVAQLKMWSSAEQPRAPLSLRIAAWLLVFHAAARRSGNPGLLSGNVEDVLASACSRYPQLPPLDNGQNIPLGNHLVSTLSDPLFTFYFQLQLLSTKVADLSHYHRNRTTGAHQEEVSVLMNSLQERMEALWQAQARRMIASPDHRTALADNRSNGDGFVHPAYLRALFLYAIESFNESETRWAVSQMRQIKDPVRYSEFFATFAEGLAEEQRAKGRRVTTKWFCWRAFGTTPPYL